LASPYNEGQAYTTHDLAGWLLEDPRLDVRRSQCDFLEVEGADELAQGNFARKAMRSTSAIATAIPESGDADFGISNPTIRQD
jgi:hypothetical protein